MHHPAYMNPASRAAWADITPSEALRPNLAIAQAPDTAYHHFTAAVAAAMARVAPATRRSYGIHIAQFAAARGLTHEGLLRWLLVCPADECAVAVITYRTRRATHLAPSTLNVFTHAVRFLTRVARAEQLTGWILAVPPIRVQPPTFTTVPEPDVERLEAGAARDPAPLRARLLLALLDDMGLTPRQIAALRAADIQWDLDGHPLAIRIARHANDGMLPARVPPKTARLIMEWHATGSFPQGSLLDLHVRGMARALARIARRAQAGRVNPMALRRMALRAACAAGLDPALLMRALPAVHRDGTPS